MEELECKHPAWLKYVGWIGLPAMLVVSLWVMAMPISNQRMELMSFLIWIPIGGFSLYMTIHGLMTLPFMNVSVILLDEGLKITKDSEPKVYPWKSIKRFNHVASVQVLHLYDSNGNRILSITEQLSGYEQLVHTLDKKTGMNVSGFNSDGFD